MLNRFWRGVRVLAVMLASAALAAGVSSGSSDARLQKAYRF